MTGRELLLAALRNEDTPRPGWLPILGAHAGMLIGKPVDEYLRSAELLTEGMTRAHELYQPDGLTAYFDLCLEAEALGCGLAWSDHQPPRVATHPLSRSRGRSGSVSGLESFDMAKGRFPVVLDATRRLKDRFGRHTAIVGTVTGPFTLACQLLGARNVQSIARLCEGIGTLVDYCAAIGREVADGLIDCGADLIVVADPESRRLHGDLFRSTAFPYINQVFEHVRRRGRYTSFFTGEQPTPNLEAMCHLRCDNLLVGDTVSLGALKPLAEIANKSLGGGLAVESLLDPDTTAAVRSARQCLDIGGSQGYILSTSREIPCSAQTATLQAVAQSVLSNPLSHVEPKSPR